MNERSVSRAQLRKRLTHSLIAGLVFFLFVVGTFFAIRLGPRSEDLPVTLREVQKLNEKVGRKLSSHAGEAPFKAAPPKGKQPRVNGLIGLEDDVDAETYRLVVESGAKTVSLSMSEIEALPVYFLNRTASGAARFKK